MFVVFDLVKWIFSKAILIALIALVIAGSFFLKKIASSWISDQESRAEKAQQVYEELRDRAGPQYTALKKEASKARKELDGKRRDLEKLANALDDLNGGWNKTKALYIPGGYDKEQWEADKKEKAERRKKLEGTIATLEAKWKKLDQGLRSFRETLPNRGELERAERNAESEQRTLEDRKRMVSDWERDALEAWKEAQPVIRTAVLLVLFGPMFWKVICYWVIGGLARHFQPIVIGDGKVGKGGEIVVSESEPALRVDLAEEEVIIVKERFFQASKNIPGDDKDTQYLWDSRFPFLSIVAGLTFLIRVRGGGDCRAITLSCDDDPAIEVIRVDLEKGEEYVFRPGFLVGYLYSSEPPEIRTLWNWSLQSWMTLRFRNFLISGDSSLFLAAGRGFNDEEITGDLVVDRDIPAMWTSNLEFKARRAETFWSYALGRNSLFDDQFTGKGRVLCQQVRGFVGGRDSASVWAKILGVVGKVFGL